jgi:PH (Pleckstrin Homology) domain-containing protein
VTGSVPPPASPPVPALPKTWRPRKARIVAFGIAAVVTLVVLLLALLLPWGGGRPFGVSDRIGIVAIGAVVVAVLVREGLVKLTADDQGLFVVNLFRKHRLDWSDVESVSLRRGDPWLMLDLADGERLAVMGIQSTDGPSARAAAAEVAALVARRRSRS